jgi:hypothetical protein
MDFTIETYYKLLKALQKQGFSFQTFGNFLNHPLEKTIIMRHDVDKMPLYSLRIARVENILGISASYYFRIVKQSYNESVIHEIISLGHEIGYHYETMDTMSKKAKLKSEKSEEDLYMNLVDDAYEMFYRNLEKFTKIYPVNTICMHGSPLSKFDNREIWKKYDYRKLGIIGEPYFDIDFSKVLYLTDTGRRWDGEKVSIRDKVINNEELKIKNSMVLTHNFKSTFDIIKAIEKGEFPDKAMFTVHPQRWSASFVPWTKELVLQTMKNYVKKHIVSQSQK